MRPFLKVALKHGTGRRGQAALHRRRGFGIVPAPVIGQNSIRGLWTAHAARPVLSIVALLDTSARAIAAGPSTKALVERGSVAQARRDVPISWSAARLVANKKRLRLRRAPDVAVVEPADLRHRNDIAAFGWLDSAWRGRILLKSEVRA